MGYRLPAMSSFQLTAEIIEQRLKVLTPSDVLIYDVLTAYGISKNLITRLRSGDLNKGKTSGSILWKNKLYYTEVMPALLLDTFAAVQKEPSILKLKPRFIIVSDGSRWAAYDTKTEQSRRIELSELYKQHDFFLPWAGIEKATITLDTPADIRAAQRMGKLFDSLKRDNSTIAPHDLNVFLARLLFCLFAEDSGIFEGENIFTNFIASVSQEDGSDLKSILERLFKVMNTPMDAPSRRELPTIYQKFPYVNGGLFAHETEVPTFSPKSRTAIIDAGGLDWEEINTDIFGNMFQACLDQEKRKTLGEHYTSVPNIMKVLRPLFLDELEEAADAAKGDMKAVEKLLQRMMDMRFFDPACGSGNFLLIAFKEMRRIEMELLESVHDKGMMRMPRISISQFYGIEIDDFAHEIATLSMWLVEHQMNQEFGERFGENVPTLPLKNNQGIVLGNALRMDWNRVCPKEDKSAAPIFTVNELLADAYQKKFFEVYVFGNPPYAGTSMQSAGQKEDMAEVFSHWPNNYKGLDYVACWLAKSVQYIGASSAKSAFVTTNSICQGEQVFNLWEPIYDKGFAMPFAYTSFKWTNNAKYQAGVTCTIVSLANRIYVDNAKLYHENSVQLVSNINAYLRGDVDVFIKPAYKSISGLSSMDYGTKPVDEGNLLLTEKEARDIVNESPVISTFIKMFAGSGDYIKGEKRYCLWLEDERLENLLQIPPIKERLVKCAEFRARSSKKATQKLAKTPHLMGEIRYKATDAIIVPSVSSERRPYVPMGYVDSDTVISNAAFAIYDAEPWVFAIISSAMHMAWMRTTCGRLESRYRYSAKLCYNTFPIRKLKPAEKELLNEAAFDVLDIRQKHTEMTLGDMYQPDRMPDDLKQAHHRMDALVDSLYRKKPFNSDEERLECLFALYKEMTH